MSKHFIKNIEIKNFKCFEDFKAEGFGRVNLIGGKNNVGKTAFMEASYLVIQQHLEALAQTFIIREKRNYTDDLQRDNILSNIDDILKNNFTITINNGKIIDSKLYENHIMYIETDILEISKKLNFNIQFLDNGLMDKQLERLYAYFQEKNREDIFNQYIKELDPSIQNFKFIQSVPKLEINGNYIHLSNFGDGLKIYIAIICSIYACKDGQLFIDEIDNGIHYSKLDKLWEIILSISKQQNIQVFATTHSKECIESYARVAKKLGEEDVTYSVLSKLKSGELLHSLYDYELLEIAIEQEHEVR